MLIWKEKIVNKSEVKLLLADVAAIDNRRVSDETVIAWHAVVGHLSLRVASRALVLARQDERVDYLEPRHIVARARDARVLIDEATDYRADEAGWRSDPQPTCRAHDVAITKCLPCCTVFDVEGDSWWAENTYIKGAVS